MLAEPLEHRVAAVLGRRAAEHDEVGRGDEGGLHEVVRADLLEVDPEHPHAGGEALGERLALDREQHGRRVLLGLSRRLGHDPEP